MDRPSIEFFINRFLYSDKLEYANYNIDKLRLYVEFCIDNSNEVSDYNVERHHILPVSIYPEYKSFKNKWNVSVLNIRDHMYTHYLLCDAIPYDKFIFSFNLMQRGMKKLNECDISELCKLYEEKRVDISQAISKSNTGKKHTEESNIALSKRMLGKATYRYSNGTLMQLPTNHPDVLSGLCVSYRVGYKHTDETLESMRENSGTKNKIRVKDIDSDNITYIDSDEFDIKKHKIDNSDLSQHGVVNGSKLWYYNEKGESRRYNPDDIIPENFTNGRLSMITDNYFAKNVRLKHIITKEIQWFNKDDIPPYYASVNANSLICILSPSGKYMSTYTKTLCTKLNIYYCEFHKDIDNIITKRTKNKWVTDNFLGKTYREIGFKYINLENLTQPIFNNLLEEFQWI